ncbi:MAG: DNA ligase D [Bryobacterales bacterium]|nr:DNA ligase D [Bryobacterales bacterium]
MPLEEYARKRSFSKTPEPAPGAVTPAAPAKTLMFCVQRHDARRLHYDFRLEVSGTLKSWAVPEGPTLKPNGKQLAVMVEDHPISYGGFEGNIPKGNYGAGSVMLWDTGTYDLLGDVSAEEQIERGDFKFHLHGQKLRGDFALVRMKTAKGNEWLLIKKKDEHAQASYDITEHDVSVLSGRTQEEIAQNLPSRLAVPAAEDADPLPDPFEPMLATLSEAVPSGPEWLYEIKWDGVRGVAFLTDRTRLYSRKRTPIDRQYPELANLHQLVNAQSAVLDGEVVALDPAGRPSFERLQPRIMASDPTAIANLARTRPVLFFAFDITYLNGRDLRKTPLIERKQILQSIMKPGGPLRLSDHFQHGRELLEVARQQALEGIVAKRGNSPYCSGRSRDWVKIKVTREQEFVITGYTEGEREYFGALILGVYNDKGKLEWAGNVGTGFDQKTLAALRAKLDPLAVAKCPLREVPKIPDKMHWVRPELVSTVKFLLWTEEGRLRAPVYVGLREDIAPEECTRQASSEETAPPRPVLFADTVTEGAIAPDNHTFRIRNLNKVWYPVERYTKRDVLNYYNAVAPLILPYLLDRPLSLRRYPNGIQEEGFFQKNTASGGFPDWIRQETIVAEDGKLRKQVIGSGLAELLYLANLGCIDQNPWMSRVQTLDNPDFILIDLDPSDCPYSKIVEAALLVRRKLDHLELDAYPKTTGGDGLHLYIPLEPVYQYDQARALAEILARLCAAERPDLFTLPRSTAKREKGKVYFDWMQIARGKTISAPYVLRAYNGAPVATPLEWRELTPSLHPSHFHIGNALDRFDRVGDLFEPTLSRRQKLEAALERMDSLVKRTTAKS